jgi:xyloglucan fucosyltransferase
MDGFSSAWPAELFFFLYNAGLPYVLEEQQNLSSLIKAHHAYQLQALSNGDSSSSSSSSVFIRAVPAIVVTASEASGVGNRLPAIVTSYVLALFTQRVLLVDAKAVLAHIKMPFPCDWEQYKARYAEAETGGNACIDVARLVPAAHGHLQYCGVPANFSSSANSSQERMMLIKYSSIDYDMPLLQINSQFAPFFEKFFPSGEVFHHVAQHLFRPAPVVVQAMSAHLEQAGDCSVGLQMRHKKPFGGEKVQAEQFAGIARMLLQQHPGTVHLASDIDVFDRMAALVGPQLRWSNLTKVGVNSSTAARNPGTELSAFVDIFLLAMCKAIVVTPASSFGAVAAGIGGLKPVFATYGKHGVPFVNPWFWQSVTSEPCMFKAGKSVGFGGEVAARLKHENPLYMAQTQCHW